MKIIDNKALGKKYWRMKESYHFSSSSMGMSIYSKAEARIANCSISICKHYVKYGNLKRLEKYDATVGIGTKVLRDLEGLLEKMTGIKIKADQRSIEKNPDSKKKSPILIMLGKTGHKMRYING